MGTLVGHVAPGFGFFLIGLWHLFNHIKLHALDSKSYTSPPWFPAPKFKYLELLLIMAGSVASVSMELFIGPNRHQPFDPDGTIPSNHLHNFEHSSISMTFFVYGAFAIILDQIGSKARHGLTILLGAVAFAQQLLLFHLHAADHTGPEGQYHMLLQIVVVVSLTTTLMGIGWPRSFLVSFVRSVSIFFQGVWLMVMGFMLWTPGLIPKGCFMNAEEGHKVVRCRTDEYLHRAKSLVNIQFSWYLLGVTIFSMVLYLISEKFYGGEKVKYFPLGKVEEDDTESNEDVESQKRSIVGNNSSFIHMGKSFSPIDMER